MATATTLEVFPQRKQKTGLLSLEGVGHLRECVDVSSILLVLRYLRGKLRRCPYGEVSVTTRKIARRFDLPRENPTLIRLGWALNYLKHLGYLKQVSTHTPKHYVLTPLGRYWVLICSYPDCAKDSSICGLYGICPIHRLTKAKEVKVK